LRRQGYKVLYRNFRAPQGGEVDIVCRHGDTLVFVEVKTRSNLDFGRPAEAVGRDKQHLVAKGALAWLRLLRNPDILFRFDIVEVMVESERARLVCAVIPNAFTLPAPYRY
jgi:putative endonuclease